MGGAERGRVLGEPRRRKHAKRAQRVAGAENAGDFWLSEQVTTKLNTAPGGDTGLFTRGLQRETMTEVAASIEIPAPPAVVWAVLTDLEAYPQWNTLLSVRGSLSEGETVAARLSIPGLPTIRIRPTVTAVEPERALRWQSTLFGVRAEHAFLLASTADGGTRFRQREQFTGPLATPVVNRLERRIRRGFEEMNLGVRRHAMERVTADRDGRPVDSSGR